ncbi:MAG: DUF192 domain-containing protein [Rhodocyclaceae bacterium]|jgi:hypothetical protein|nr:DUF192 domain-containing protein [Rhodocyclaceae bacterium]
MAVSRIGWMAVGWLVCGSAFAQSFPVIDLSAGIRRIEAEVAATQKNRMQGLMNRLSMATNHGMLFVFASDDRHCMWMRNTLIPLSVAFLDAAGKIINIEDMQPRTENNHCAARPARYALEMNLGWFRQHGIGADAPLSGLEKAPPPQ